MEVGAFLAVVEAMVELPPAGAAAWGAAGLALGAAGVGWGAAAAGVGAGVAYIYKSFAL